MNRSNSKPRNLGRRLAKIARKTELNEADRKALVQASRLLVDIHSLLHVHVRRFARAAADPLGVEFRHACGRHPNGQADALTLLSREAFRIDACIGLDCSEKPPVVELAKFLISERRFV
jgi:hypothetical protein